MGDGSGTGLQAVDYVFCCTYILATFFVSVRSAQGSISCFTGTKTMSRKVLENGYTSLPNRSKSMSDISEAVLGDMDSETYDPENKLQDTEGKRRQENEEIGVNRDDDEKYFFAGHKANGFVVAMSLVSGLTSGISFLGIPAYAYKNGFGIVAICISPIIASYFVAWVIMPFYCNLHVKTVYSYLELRFNRSIRTGATLIFCFRMIAYLTVVIQAPALLFESTSGVPRWITATICGLGSTLFTMKGGMTTVIVTDFMQSIALVVGAICILGTAVAGSNGINDEDIDINYAQYFSLSSWKGDNFWYFFIGTIATNIYAIGTDQIAIQRLMSTKNLKSAQWTTIASGWLSSLMVLLLLLCGLYLRAFYRVHDNKPMHHINEKNIVSQFMLHDTPPGFTGIIIASILGSTISVISGGLNSAAMCFHIDIIQNVFSKEANAAQVVQQSRYLTFLFGLSVTCLAVLLSYVKIDIITLSNLAVGLFVGPIGATFLVGIMVRRANSKGMLISLGATFFLIIYVLAGEIYCSSDYSLSTICQSFFLYANMNAWATSALFGGFAALLGISLSYMSPAPPRENILNLTYWT
jgi:solute:Na+ symporter, SSS family